MHGEGSSNGVEQDCIFPGENITNYRNVILFSDFNQYTPHLICGPNMKDTQSCFLIVPNLISLESKNSFRLLV